MNLNNTSKERAVIIAEAGINHDGDIEKAKKMIEAASRSGADYVKFQSFKSKKLVTPTALTSSYIDEGSRDGETFEDLLARLEIDEDAHYELKKHCDKCSIKFLSTAFDEESFDFLIGLGIDLVKVASGDLTNIPLLKYFARSGLPIILSTGMSTLGEIEDAIAAIESQGNYNITLLHCISWYPAEIASTNLNYMGTLRTAFQYPVGYSDHTLGITMSIAASALGATCIEKHFTLDKNDFGPDHSASIEPIELLNLVRSVREVEIGMGVSRRQFCEKELGQRLVHRKSIVLKSAYQKGHEIVENDLALKRPGTGIKPKYIDRIIGKSLRINVSKDHILQWEDLIVSDKD
jgi:N,N'-diacetyllegionaminate synthase